MFYSVTNNHKYVFQTFQMKATLLNTVLSIQLCTVLSFTQLTPLNVMSEVLASTKIKNLIITAKATTVNHSVISSRNVSAFSSQITFESHHCNVAYCAIIYLRLFLKKRRTQTFQRIRFLYF